MTIGMPAQDALQVLEAWKAAEAMLRQDPQWRDRCFSCGAENAPQGPSGPSLREGWECYWCHCC